MWTHGHIGDVLTLIQNGVNCKQDKSGVGDKITRIETIADSSINYEKTGFAELDDKQKAKALLESGDILFSHINSPIHVGKTAIYDGKEPLFHGINLLRLRTIEQVDSSYFNMFLVSLFQSGYWKRTAKQSVNQASVNQTDIKSVPFSYPPLAEQQRIVAKLDAAFAEIDRAVEIATACLENTKAIINSTLNELFIAEGKQWSVVPLADTCIIERGSSPRPIKQFLTKDEGVNWIKIGDTDKDGKYVRGTKEKITFEGAKKSRSVRKGDFILTNSMSYGRPYIMEIDGCIHDGWFALRLNENIDAEYYYYLLASPYVQNQFHTLAAGAVVKNISSDLVKRAVLPMPPLARQIEIRNRILALEAHTQEAANCHRAKIQQLSHLKPAILAQELQPPQSEAA